MCLKPWFNPKTQKTTPCGGCIGCRQDAMRLWTARAQTEMIKGRNSFVTLTYDTEHLHYHENQFEASLDREAVKKWLDNLRHQIKQIKQMPEGSRKDYKYLLVGEYGGTFQRPHIHALFAGLDYADFKNYFQKLWKNGHTVTENVTTGRIKYVLDYTMKALKGQLAMKAYDERGIERPFRLVSKGFGAEYIKAHAKQINETGYIISGSRKIIVPTYYKNMYLKFDEESIASREAEKLEILRARRERANGQGRELWENDEMERKAKQQVELEKIRRQNRPIELEFLNDWQESPEEILIQGEKLT